MNRIEFVLVLLFTFFVIVVWITSDVILVKPNTPDDPKIQTLIEPLNPNFDQDAMKLISNRTLSTPIKSTPRPAATPTTPIPPPQSSISPSPTPQPSLSPVEASTQINDAIDALDPSSTVSPSPSAVIPVEPSPTTIP